MNSPEGTDGSVLDKVATELKGGAGKADAVVGSVSDYRQGDRPKQGWYRWSKGP